MVCANTCVVPVASAMQSMHRLSWSIARRHCQVQGHNAAPAGSIDSALTTMSCRHLMLWGLPRLLPLMSAEVLLKDSRHICAASAAGVPGSERLPAPGGASASGLDTSAMRQRCA
jgi:hypothetical protein